MALDVAAVGDRIGQVWPADIVPALHDYIAIPNVSPAYEPGWAEAGHMDAAVALVRDWCAARPIRGLTVDVQRLPGRTPLVVVDIPACGGADDDTVVLYGHLDKQPEMVGWRDGMGPWTPVVEGDRLYGRGGADDGYAAFAALAAVEAVQAAGGAHTRLMVLIEASEESGSPDLPAHVEALGPRLGTPSLVVCLDSGCADYDRLWVTTSLRGNLVGTLSVDVLTEGVHSGTYGGVVPSTMRILRLLLERLEDARTGALRLHELNPPVPKDRRRQAEEAVAAGVDPTEAPPLVPGVALAADDPVELLLAKTWRPSLAYTGADGFPPVARAGNVLRPRSALKLSLRLAPTTDAAAATRVVRDVLEADPPYGATVRFTAEDAAPGWAAPPFAPWLDAALEAGSQAAFGRSYGAWGEGGTIPFMAMLGARFPEAQFVVTGVLGPGSNAHGPNEFLHLPTGRRVTEVVATVLDAHPRRQNRFAP